MNKILEYQNLDAELVALDKQVETSAEHEVLSKMGAVVKEMQTKLLWLEDNAKKLSADYNETFTAYQQGLASVKKLTEGKLEKLSEEQLNDSLEEANKLSGSLFMLERKLNQLVLNIQNSLKEFEITKNKALSARNKYGEAKSILEKQKTDLEPRKTAIMKQLQKLEPQLDESLFAKYKALKHDNVFPAFVPLAINRCGYCRVELPSSKLDELKNKDFIVCEQCRRYIYKEE